MSYSRVAILLLVCAIALPTGLFQPAPGRDAGRDPSLAAASSGSTANPAVADAPLFKKAEKHGDKRKAGATRKNDARDGRARDERGKKTSAARKPAPDRDQVKAQVAPTWRELTELPADQCDGPGMIFLPKSGLCTHGPDPAPPGVDPTARANRVATAAVCDGNGQSGPRVQVLYAHASDSPNRFSTYHDSFRTWTAETDAIMQESAAAAGGALRFRFVTEPAPGCAIDVQHVTLSPTGDDSFDNTIVELKAQGFTRTDRYYLIFVDATSAGICGIATGSGDDSPGQANWNNYGPGFSRVDTGCWGASTAAHELMHNLGAVNDSAPHTSRGGHCIDDFDIMCYSDEPFFPAMQIVCPDDDREVLYDCGSDDYFNPNSAPGSYLDTHWNTADNRFLVGGGNGGDEDGAPPTVTWVSPTGNDGTHETATGTIPLEATATDGSGINRVEFWRYDDNQEDWGKFATDRSPPYTASISVADLEPGFNFIGANVLDGVGNFTFEQIRIKRTAPPPPIVITSPRDGATVKANQSITVAVAVNDNTGPTVVEIRSCDGSACAWAAAATLGSDASAPYSVSWTAPGSGSVTFLAQMSDDSGPKLSEPVTVSVEEPKAKKKKKKKR